MLKITVSELSLCNVLRKTSTCLYSTVAQVNPLVFNQNFRATETNPANHSLAHCGLYYKLSNDVKQRIFQHGGLPKSYDVQTKTFTETCFMIREPALDLIHSMKTLDYSKPVVRFVLYGEKGNGKTLSLAHVLHYAHNEGYLIVHVPWVGNWMRRSRENSPSLTREGFTDLNMDAAAWLVHFKQQNATTLQNPDLITSREYVWSKRENTPENSPLLHLVDHGINRIKYASDCVVILAEEIKRLCNEDKCKALVAVDGFNAFFYDNTNIKTEKKETVVPGKVILTEAFVSLTRFDWKNAVCVLIVDELAIAGKDQVSHLPRYVD